MLDRCAAALPGGASKPFILSSTRAGKLHLPGQINTGFAEPTEWLDQRVRPTAPPHNLWRWSLTSSISVSERSGRE